MAVDTVHRYPVNQDKAPEALAQFEVVEIRPGTGLVGISGEKESRIQGLGHLVVELAQGGGVLGEEMTSPDLTAEEGLRGEITRLEERLTLERRQHAEEITRLTEGYEAEIAGVRQAFDDYKRETEERLEKLETKATVKPDPVKAAPGAGGDEIKFDPGDKVRFWNGRKIVQREVYEVKGNQVGIIDPDDPKKQVHYVSPAFLRPGTVEETSYTEERRPRRRSPLVREEVEEEYRGFAWNNRSLGAIGALAVGAVGVISAVLWETVGERIFGFHDGGVTKNAIVNHFNDQDAILRHRINSLSAQVSGLAAAEKAEKAHEHAQNMGIQQLKREELEENRAFTAYKFAFRYPWDWAANKFGIYRASSALHYLAAQAAAHGHRVQWFGSGRRQMLKIDGSFDTGRVVGILSQNLK